MLKTFLTTATLAASVAFAGHASAATIDFYSPDGADQTLGSQSSFDGLNVRAFRYTKPFEQTDNYASETLTQANGGGSSTGFGLGVRSATGDDGLGENEFLAVDSGDYGKTYPETFDRSVMFEIASLDDGDMVDFYMGQPNHGNSLLLGSLSGSDADETGLGSFTISGDAFMGSRGRYNNLYIVGNSGSVTLRSVSTVADVPEPGAIALFALGLLGLGVFARRRLG